MANKGGQSNVVYIVYGNHGPSPSHLEDIIELTKQSLLLVPMEPRIAERIVPGFPNILIENFDDDFVKYTLRIKQESPSTKYYILVTEEATTNSFNDFDKASSGKKISMSQYLPSLGRLALTKLLMLLVPFRSNFQIAFDVLFEIYSKKTEHYKNKVYWRIRFENFKRLCNSSREVWCCSDLQLKGYQDLSLKIPVKSLPCVTSRNQPIIQHEDSEKTYDILFTGNVTDYRQLMITRLREAGYKVIVGTGRWPSYVRLNYIKKSKFMIHIKQNSEWKFPSFLRLHQGVECGSLILSETTEKSCDQDDFVEHFFSDSYLEDIKKQFELKEFSSRGLEQFRRYKEFSVRKTSEVRSFFTDLTEETL